MRARGVGPSGIELQVADRALSAVLRLQQRFPDARPPPVGPAAPRGRTASRGVRRRAATGVVGRLLQSIVLDAACRCGVGLVSTRAVRPSGSGGRCSRALMEEECAWAASVW